jgi:DNA-directed RNA polymerases I, II, and III subunit RPABC1
MTPSARKVGIRDSSNNDSYQAVHQVISVMAHQYKLEEFSESDLLVNITRHFLVPRHYVLNPEEKKVLLDK